uniref:PSMD12/CSN4-like N-terminal domain-containing protein n=1 Tax=Glossina morsitans morsitans TaxID=37546 RepID=A0A1B0FCI2_GLOMM
MANTVESIVRRLLPINNFKGSPMVQVNSFVSLLDEILADMNKNLYDIFDAFVRNMVSGKVNVVVARMTIGKLISKLRRISDVLAIDLCQITLERLPKNFLFDEHIADVIQLNASIVERHGFAKEAAVTLATLPFEKASSYNTVLFRFDMYVKIASLFLEADDVGQAEVYIKRAAKLESKITVLQSTISYRMYYARILERKHKFAEAAERYIDLSSIPHISLPVLQRAIVCTILSPVCQERSMLLAQLHQDNRIKNLLAHDIIEKMHLQIVVNRPELQIFETLLQEHHKTITTDGTSVYDRAIIEHNVMACDKICDIISFEALAAVSGTPIDVTELVASKMIAEGRLEGHIGE